jgi:hypothetical protein
MTQFYTREFSNTLNDCREILILDIHGQAVLIEGNLGFWDSGCGAFAGTVAGLPGAGMVPPGRTWRFALGVARPTERGREGGEALPSR